MTQYATATRRPMNVAVARDSPAEQIFRAQAGLPGAAAAVVPEALAPGFAPTPAHDLIYHHGKTIPHLTYTNFYVGGAAAWQRTDTDLIDRTLAAAMSDRRLNNVMAQYFAGVPTTTFVRSQILPGPPPAVVSQGDVEALVLHLHTQGQLARFDLGQTVFNFLLPRGTILNTDPEPTGNLAALAASGQRNGHAVPEEEEADSRHGLGGYHGSVHVPQSGRLPGTIYYAVGVFSASHPDGSHNGIPVFDQPWKNVVATFYHELNEARTDPDVEDAIKAGDDPAAVKFLGWTSLEGEECGDFPMMEADPLTEVFQEVPLAKGHGRAPVQFQYSNAAHGPEGPIETPYHPRQFGEDTELNTLIAALAEVQQQEQALADQQATLQARRQTLTESLAESLRTRLDAPLLAEIADTLVAPAPSENGAAPPEEITALMANGAASRDLVMAAGNLDTVLDLATTFTIQFNYDKAQAHPLSYGYDLRPTRNGQDPIPLTGIVLHSTEGARGEPWPAALTFIRDSPNVSAHYYVSKTGAIERILDPGPFRAWHAGLSLYNGLRDWNNFAVGIELHHAHGEGPYPDVQLAALRWLCRTLIQDHPTIVRANIALHRWIAVDESDHTGRKSDPTDLDDAFWRTWIAGL